MNTDDRQKKTPDWRSRATFEAYNKRIAEGGLDAGCRLCEAPSLTEYVHWRLIPNDFPYDRVAEVHHMIIPRRHTDGEDLSDLERKELSSLLKDELNKYEYNYILQSLPKNMSIPAHLHYHLIKARSFDQD